MKLSQFFISRPIFCRCALGPHFPGRSESPCPSFPISEYPEVGAADGDCEGDIPRGPNPKVIAETVASPLEQSINWRRGDALSVFTSEPPTGVMTLTITFRTEHRCRQRPQVQVQKPRIADPAEAPRRRAAPGAWSTNKGLSGPDHGGALGVFRTIATTTLYLSNYALLRVKDELARAWTAVGDVQVFGAGQFSMRVLAGIRRRVASPRPLTAGRCREGHPRGRTSRSAAGPARRTRRCPARPSFRWAINAKGRLNHRGRFFAASSSRPGLPVKSRRLKDVGARRTRRRHLLRCALSSRRQAGGPRFFSNFFSAPAATSIAILRIWWRAKNAGTEARLFRRAVEYQNRLRDPTVFRARLHSCSGAHA